MRVQVTVTVNEGKKLIAEAVYNLDVVKKALNGGKVLLKGGTTVSALAEKIVGTPLRISGRVSSLGTKCALRNVNHPHSILIENGNFRNADKDIKDIVLSMNKNDVIVIGANAIDVHGNAAMMAGSPGGGLPGLACSAMTCEGAKVIIACGLEKLIPGNIIDIVKLAGRKSADAAYGMSVGLIPIFGELITEVEAVKTIGDIDATVIGKGGLGEAVSALTMLLDGEKEEVFKVLKVLEKIKGAEVSGLEESMEECRPGPSCKEHLACCYSNPQLLRK